MSDEHGAAHEDPLLMMLKDFLLSDGDITAADTAHRINDFYTQEYFPSDPLMRFQEDRGMGGFLSGFWDAVFTLGRLIPYNSSKQEKLVQLILKLRKLPPRQFRIWKVCYVLLSAVLPLLLILTSLPGGLPRLDPGRNVCGVHG